MFMRSPRGTIAVMLAGSLLPCPCTPAFAARASLPKRDAPGAAAKIQDAKALHLLDRMTFGPRPGDIQRVEVIGIDRWLNLQLHPAKIDDSALGQRLAGYRAPFMTPQQLMVRFPSPNLIRQALNGRFQIPNRQPQKAIWESQIAIIQQRQLAKQSKVANQNDNALAVGPSQPANVMAESADNAPSSQIDEPDHPTGIDTAVLLELPPQQRYQKLLNLQAGQMPLLVRSMAPRDRPDLVAGMTPEQRETVVALLNPRMVVVNETEAVRLQEDIYSQRQLERVMTEFWLNHFNIFTNKNEIEPYYLSQFESEAIAPHALGRFEDLLDAVAHSPAMLIYLDNIQSIGPDSIAALRSEYPGTPRLQLVQMMNADVRAMRGAVPSQSHIKPRLGINENYGRELMELHTLGVDGGYSQQDVIQAARVLTGWTVASPRQGGGFQFEPNRHEPGDKIVIGHRIRQGGEDEGLQLLHILATSPATAHFISRELAVRFVSDHPSQALVNRIAKTFLSTHGDIAKVLKTMIDSPEFWSAPDTGNKIKTPLDYVVSAVRATNADVSQPYRLVSELRVMGMPLTGTQQPNGYSMTNDAWGSSSELIDRMNFALALASNRIPGVAVSLDQFLGPDAAEQKPNVNPEQVEALLEQAILHAPAPEGMHEAVLESLSETVQQTRAAASVALAGDGGANPFDPGPNRSGAQTTSMQRAIMAALLIGSPEFQRR